MFHDLSSKSLIPLVPPPPSPNYLPIPMHNVLLMLPFCCLGLDGPWVCFVLLGREFFSQVLAADIDVLHLSEDIVVVNKPASIPVHPTGNFRVSMCAPPHSQRDEVGSLLNVHQNLTSFLLLNSTAFY